MKWKKKPIDYPIKPGKIYYTNGGVLVKVYPASVGGHYPLYGVKHEDDANNFFVVFYNVDGCPPEKDSVNELVWEAYEA